MIAGTPLAAALQTVASRRVLLFGGKGGVGKTTIAAAAAKELAKSRRTIPISVAELDANALYDGFLEKNLEQFLEIGDRGTYLDREELRRFFELSLPGIDEVMTWLHIGEVAETNPDAIVIVDTAPTGHTLRMLDASEHFGRFALALDSMQEKHRQMVRQLTRRDTRDAIDQFITRFEQDASRRRALLADPASAAFIPVLLAEPWVVEQTVRLIAEVRADGIDVPFAILNRASGSGADHEATEKLAPLRVVEVHEEAGAETPITPAGTTFLDVSPRMLFLAGKGGVGKTTCAASIALQLARANPAKRYTIISVDPAHALRDVFAIDQPPENLAVEMIDTRAKWQRFRETLGDEIERAMNAITPSGITLAYDTEALKRLIEIAPPGADELFAISRLSGLAVDSSIEKIIVDTAPTGHFLRLLELPKTAGEWVREFMRILLRYRDLIPAGSLGEELVEASRSLKALEDTLHGPDAGVIVVTRPERMVIDETERLIAELERRGIPIAGVIANYVAGDQSAILRALPPHLVIARQPRPVTRLDDLARLVPLASH
ncbi:MAG: TRC40/GET3/ArsA family transport-energizing ATPase [Thermoanaerobaculia bacterium]|nr:TRC40/GET3/ArsA family transport-energizing ATPase [Thermoanaerobaculia bacterium]